MRNALKTLRRYGSLKTPFRKTQWEKPEWRKEHVRRHVQLERFVQLWRHQHWWFLHVPLDFIKSLLLLVTPYKFLILLDPQ
jgi:hypothetical protein